MPIWVTATQPLMFPPLYMYERFARCHVVVIMEEAQHSRSAEHSWFQLGQKDGVHKIPVPCRDKNRRPMDEIAVAELDQWADKLQKRCQHVYGKCDGYREVKTSFDGLLDHLVDKGPWTLASLAETTMDWLAIELGLYPVIRKSKQLVPVRPEEPTEWLARLTQAAGGTDYIQGVVSIENYFEKGRFAPKGIRLWGQNWPAPDAPRLCPEPTLRLSALDPLFVAGPDWCRQAIGADLGTGTANRTAVDMSAWA